MSYWFRNKRYGYGASPANWKGWLATLIFVALLAVLNLELAGQPPLIHFGSFAALLVAFLWLVWSKSEGDWHWRWGSNKKEN
jgi:hypothetical protein